MRLLFDAFWWSRGPTANRTVMREIIFGWSRRFPEDEIVLAVRKKHGAPRDVPLGAELVTTRLSPQAISNAVELPLLARRVSADATVVHNYAPLIGSSLVFIHDLLFEQHPEWFSRKERIYFAPMGVLAHRSRVVATSSRTEAARITQLHPRLAPVEAVGLAVAPALVHSIPSKPHGLDGVDNFLVSVGRLNLRKNLRVVIEAAMQSTSVTSERPLVIVGSSEFSGAAAELPASVQEHVASRRLVFLGRISDGELRWVYENTDGLIFLSLDEGFGLPPIEASYFGAPIIASDIPVMREVVGDSASFVPPQSVTALASSIERLPARRLSPAAREDVERQWEDIASRLRHRVAAVSSERTTKEP